MTEKLPFVLEGVLVFPFPILTRHNGLMEYCVRIGFRGVGQNGFSYSTPQEAFRPQGEAQEGPRNALFLVI